MYTFTVLLKLMVLSLFSTVNVRVINAKYFLTACAMIRNEMSIILEWIEFHRIQGVDHFVFLDDESTDDIYYLPRLYEDVGYPDLVEVIPQNFRKRQKPNDHSYRDYVDGQFHGLNHCNTRLAGLTEWLLVTDVDEFMFSPKHYTIANYLRNETSNDNSEVSVPAIRFGSNGVQNENRVRLSFDPYVDRISVIQDIFNDNPLIMSRNPNRGPFPDLDADFGMKFNKTCALTKNPDDCDHANGKSIWRPDKCGQAFVHWCDQILNGSRLHPLVDDIRINHYTWRSREHVDGLPKNQMGTIKTAAFEAFDNVWFSSVKDTTIDSYRDEVLRRLAALPSITIYYRKANDSDWLAKFLRGDGVVKLGKMRFFLDSSLHYGVFITWCVGLVWYVSSVVCKERPPYLHRLPH